MQGRTNAIGELCRRSASPPFGSVNGNEIKIQAGLNHSPRNSDEFPRVPDTEFYANRLAARQRA